MVIWHPKNAVWAMVAILVVIIACIKCCSSSLVRCDRCKGTGETGWLFKSACERCNGSGQIRK